MRVSVILFFSYIVCLLAFGVAVLWSLLAFAASVVPGLLAFGAASPKCSPSEDASLRPSLAAGEHVVGIHQSLLRSECLFEICGIARRDLFDFQV